MFKFASLFADWRIWTLATFDMQDFIAILTASKPFNPEFGCSPLVAVAFYILVQQFVALYCPFLAMMEPESVPLESLCKLLLFDYFICFLRFLIQPVLMFALFASLFYSNECE